MKKMLAIVSVLFVALLLLFGLTEYINYRNELEFIKSKQSNKTPFKTGFETFYNQMKKEDKNFEKRKYFYFNIWETACKPCVAEMPYLDSLAAQLSSDIQCFLVTEQSNDLVINFLNKRHLSLPHLTVKNELKDFIAGIYNEKKNGSRSYPLHVIMDSDGNFIYVRGMVMKMSGSGKDIFLEKEFEKLGLFK